MDAVRVHYTSCAFSLGIFVRQPTTSSDLSSRIPAGTDQIKQRSDHHGLPYVLFFAVFEFPCKFTISISICCHLEQYGLIHLISLEQ